MVPLRKQVAELRLFQTARLGNQQRVGGEPARRCQRSRGAWQQAGLIGRIQKHQTTGGARRGAECIGRNHTRLGAGAGREIETQRLQGRAIPLHEGGMGRPAGKGFQAERSGSGKRIQNGDAVEPTAPGMSNNACRSRSAVGLVVGPTGARNRLPRQLPPTILSVRPRGVHGPGRPAWGCPEAVRAGFCR